MQSRLLQIASVLAAVFVSLVQGPPIPAEGETNVWPVRLLINILGYATLVVPAALLIKYLKKINYKEKGSGICFPVVKTCVFGDEVGEHKTTDQPAPLNITTREPSTFVSGIKLAFCAVGLQVSYLTWGVIQERIMTIEYGKTDDTPGEKFGNSQFLVFVNRSLAFIVAGLYIAFTRQPRHGCPLHKFSYSSISNIMSSWFQYEALKYVSFPTQVLGKACKVIPVMLMGKVVSGNTYEFYEWATAGMLSVGISLFLLSQGQSGKHAAHDAIDITNDAAGVVLSGFILMVGYMAFDSFTSNWQGQLFKTYKMSSFQMMFGVNLFSCLFTSVSLLEQGGFFQAFAFMASHLDFAMHSVILSICSAVGQLFIFYTISEFGPVIFTIIMTTRQALAILLSCLIYGHPVSAIGGLGILVVFFSLFLRIYARTRKTALAKQQKPIPSPNKV
ncbi:adenosine 3'-phospho 5'-phosphosulfate transporter 1-like [Styela clava]